MHANVEKDHNRVSWVALISITTLQEFNRVLFGYGLHMASPIFMSTLGDWGLGLGTAGGLGTGVPRLAWFSFEGTL